MNDIYIEEDKSVLDAINLLDQNARKILFVHQNHKLLATVTDGDIRRWILKKGDLQRSVKYVANYHPKFLCEEQEALAIRTMKEYGIDAIPIVDKNHVIKKVVFINDSVQEHGMFKKKKNPGCYYGRGIWGKAFTIYEYFAQTIDTYW